MKYKKIFTQVKLISVLILLGFISITVHEYVHVLQGYLLFGVTGIEVHYFWEGTYLDAPWYHFPLAWTVIPGVDNNIWFEVMAYGVQFAFMFVVYFKYIYNNKYFFE